eukprot:2256389-Pleurochrysis_carterae.AAC.1
MAASSVERDGELVLHCIPGRTMKTPGQAQKSFCVVVPTAVKPTCRSSSSILIIGIAIIA